MTGKEPPDAPDRIDWALDAWFAALDMIGGLKPHQRARFRLAMAAAIAAADGDGAPVVPLSP